MESRPPEAHWDREELRSMYGAYRRRQARKLVSMLPRDAIRPLYRAAVGNRAVADMPTDPLEVLVAHCATLLPLPPFPVWMADVVRFPDAHLDDLDESVEGPDTATTSVALGSRSVRFGGAQWRAVLRAFRADGAWRGFIAFEGTSVGDTCRTAVVFRESSPVALRDRFSAFDTVALEAFLRSSLP